MLTFMCMLGGEGAIHPSFSFLGPSFLPPNQSEVQGSSPDFMPACLFLAY